MIAEILLNLLIPVFSALLVIHCFLTRKRAMALLCLAMGIGFGILFPVVHVSIFHRYSFHVKHNLWGIPPFLPLFWWCTLYISLCLAERIVVLLPLAKGKMNGAICFLAGTAMLIMEVIWDDLAVRKGMLDFRNLMHLWYNPGFHNGIAPQINVAHFIFAYVYAYTIVYLKQISEANSLSRLLLIGLIVMSTTVCTGLYFRILSLANLDSWLGPTASLALDIGVSLMVAAIYVLQTRWLFAIVSRKMLYGRPKQNITHITILGHPKQ